MLEFTSVKVTVESPNGACAHTLPSDSIYMLQDIPHFSAFHFGNQSALPVAQKENLPWWFREIIPVPIATSDEPQAR
jgi:hypothetical protein